VVKFEGAEKTVRATMLDAQRKSIGCGQRWWNRGM